MTWLPWTGEDLTGFDHTELDTARLSVQEALPNELAFLQSFSFLDELERREDAALKEELGCSEDEIVTEEEEEEPKDTPQAFPLPFQEREGDGSEGDDFDFDADLNDESFGHTFEASFGQALDMAAVEAALQSPVSAGGGSPR